MLVNRDGFALGTRQDGRPLGDVQLPPWANGSPETFIRLHRQALESEYVSANLHRWIDLIFGEKQRGPAAVEAMNMFFHLTYDHAVDLDKLKDTDKKLYDTTIKQIDNFGQTPPQLLTRPHPARSRPEDFIFPLFSNRLGLGHKVALKKPEKLVAFPRCRTTDQTYDVNKVDVEGRGGALIFLCECMGLAGDRERLVTIDSRRTLKLHRWKPLSPDVQPPFQLVVDPVSDRKVGVPFATTGIASNTATSLILQARSSSRSNFTEVLSAMQVKSLSAVNDSGDSRRTGGSRSADLTAGLPDDHGEYMLACFHRQLHYLFIVFVHQGCYLSYGEQADEQSLSEAVGPCSFAVSPDGKTLYSCGHWDHSFTVTALDSNERSGHSASTVGSSSHRYDQLSMVFLVFIFFLALRYRIGRTVQSVTQHRDVVTCLALSPDGHYLVTGSRDTTVMVWQVHPVLFSDGFHVLILFWM